MEKAIISIISDANKVSNELFLNSWLGAAPGVLASVYTMAYVTPANYIQEIMRINNYSDELLDEFIQFAREGYVVFNQDCLDDINQLHERYKKSKYFQWARSESGPNTIKLKNFLQKPFHDNNDNLFEECQRKNTVRILAHIKRHATDFSVVLMDYFMTGRLFKPSEKFKEVHNKIVQVSGYNNSLDDFFLGLIHGSKEAKALFEEIENYELEDAKEMISSYHQTHIQEARDERTLEQLDHNHAQELQKLEKKLAHELEVLTIKQRFEIQKKELMATHQRRMADIQGEKNISSIDDTFGDQENSNNLSSRETVNLLARSREALIQSHGTDGIIPYQACEQNDISPSRS